MIAAIKLVIHLYAGRHYGYFVDELYYLACAQPLAWGYVDQPPLIALIAKIARSLFGESLSAIRLFPALAGAGMVLLTGLIARELGANGSPRPPRRSVSCSPRAFWRSTISSP